MSDFYRPKGLSSAVCYVDPKSAFRWLEEAFGFEPLMVILDENDNIAHSEMKYGDSVVMIGTEWSADHKSPKSMGGKNTQTVHVQLARGEDIDGHCERARKAGAEITAGASQRSFTATAPIVRVIAEGHIWTFGVTVQEDVGPAELGTKLRAACMRTQTRL
jgi:uncharacterized glyoxalase superfamily protein PhnB